MADWNSPLPDTAEVGDETHVEDHNAIVAALDEVRSNVDAVEATAEAAPAWGDVTGKPASFAPADHQHAIDDVDGLEAALDGKQSSGNYATAADLTALADRVEALEAAAPEA